MTSPTGRKTSRAESSGHRESQPRRLCAPRPAGGFTLLELIAVLAVVSIVLVLAWPSLRGFVASRQTADAANSMLALTEYARTQAVAEGRPYRLNIDADSGAYWLTVQQDTGDFVQPGTDLGQQFRVPDGARVAIRQPDPQTVPIGQPANGQQTGQQTGQPSGGLFGRTSSVGGFGALGQLGARANNAAPTYITFSPSRRSDPYTVELRGPQGELYLLACPSATEPFKVTSPAKAN